MRLSAVTCEYISKLPKDKLAGMKMRLERHLARAEKIVAYWATHPLTTDREAIAYAGARNVLALHKLRLEACKVRKDELKTDKSEKSKV